MMLIHVLDVVEYKKCIFVLLSDCMNDGVCSFSFNIKFESDIPILMPIEVLQFVLYCWVSRRHLKKYMFPCPGPLLLYLFCFIFFFWLVEFFPLARQLADISSFRVATLSASGAAKSSFVPVTQEIE